jgi:hypothetical protein
MELKLERAAALRDEDGVDALIPRRGRYSHPDEPLYTLYGESRMKYTGRCEDDFSVQGYGNPSPGPQKFLVRSSVMPSHGATLSFYTVGDCH